MTITHMTNAQGHLVPIEMVRPADQLENDVVLSLFNQAQSLHDTLSAFKKLAFADVYAFIEVLQEQYKVVKGGKKGNMTLTAYDGLTKIQISVADLIAFGPQLTIAKNLIDECIREWGVGSDNKIKVLVDHAFRTDKNNRVNTASILGLRRLPIQDDKWKLAMEAIGDSMRVQDSKSYIRFYRRPSPESNWQAVTLDLAAV